MNRDLDFLKEIQSHLEYIDYPVVYQNIAQLGDKFIPTAILKEGHYIDRVRINKPEEIFTRQDQLSYISDSGILKSCNEFGRVNEPHQSVFYGAIKSPEISLPRVVAYFETSRILRNINENNIDDYDDFIETFTVSRWRIRETIAVVEMIFSEDALKNSSYAKMFLGNQINNYLATAERYGQDKNLKEFIDESKFFSDEFSKPVKSHLEYKISAAYANYIWRNTHLKGITYPSVQSIYKGQNVALLPEVVDRYLELEKVALCVFERRHKENLPSFITMIAEDLGKNKMDFQWKNA